MELQLCKIAAAAALIFVLLLTIGTWARSAGQRRKQRRNVCSALDRSKTFNGACDVADPGHRVCMCTGPCGPETAAAAASRGNTV
ncbi:hypothetical protein SETIT_1G071300v2 [Setaria italica]|uniref:Uncharacterized protein n=2 Tax=Setaria TaxID=4554 RepID=A0A368PHM7_SETIT|nr:hypothetical protein SETIT_1G071300v2 [Setaria italica]TKW37769.1 hypothetical protein SEVIR_1G069800v2 [Setaria viridis]